MRRAVVWQGQIGAGKRVLTAGYAGIRGAVVTGFSGDGIRSAERSGSRRHEYWLWTRSFKNLSVGFGRGVKCPVFPYFAAKLRALRLTAARLSCHPTAEYFMTSPPQEPLDKDKDGAKDGAKDRELRSPFAASHATTGTSAISGPESLCCKSVADRLGCGSTGVLGLDGGTTGGGLAPACRGQSLPLQHTLLSEALAKGAGLCIGDCNAYVQVGGRVRRRGRGGLQVGRTRVRRRSVRAE